MNEPMTTAAVPRHVRWFAPWTWSRWKLVVLFGLPGLLLCYAASGGPAVWLVERDYLSSSMVEWVYRPVVSLGDRFDGQFGGLSYFTYLRKWSSSGAFEVRVWRRLRYVPEPNSHVPTCLSDSFQAEWAEITRLRESKQKAQGTRSLGFDDHASEP